MASETTRHRSVGLVFGVVLTLWWDPFVALPLGIGLALVLESGLRSLPRWLVMHRRGETGVAESWTVALGWWIPRKYRADLVGDILEDCFEMRMLGAGERRICVHVAYQWLIGVMTLLPLAITSGIAGTIRQIIAPRK